MSKILNLIRLERKLKRLPEVAKAEIRAGMEAAANDIVAMMKSLAPGNGALRDSIGWTWGKVPKGAGIVAAVKAQTGGDQTITIYAGNAEAYYARWVEFGTAPHKNGGMYAGTQNPGTKARPFFYVSWRASKKAAKGKVRQAVRAAARKVAS
ncbi:HK97 gp10 family phage protein [Allorhizobium sp. BGMRC 0089]|uniref:HK97-gp10 family putative phage morphogenesis protein n=1 Tax=Allorhizobium sonneratiae TaxID=2934936 RepID=UPI002033E348|nr:HK97-gp10 family putative phage morphogenesis protein [Allorhizobium sonneratiae]MCM2292293.1 HK97 gp10 family phage protein [Allorhizobium sonneratiae]